MRPVPSWPSRPECLHTASMIRILRQTYVNMWNVSCRNARSHKNEGGRGRFGPARPLHIALVCLACVLHGACFADHRDLNLARVFQTLLNLLDHVTRQPLGGKVVDQRWRHEDSHLASGLDRKRLLDAVERI